MINLSQIKIKSDLSIRKAAVILDKSSIGFCVVINNNDIVIGVFSDGDYRRSILNNVDLNCNIITGSNLNFLRVEKGYKDNEVKEIFVNSVVKFIPVLDAGKLINIIAKEDFNKDNELKLRRQLNNSVVVMAGGKGTRLHPFTKILPKPLIPIGDDPVIDLIINEFKKHSINDFYITINDKAKMIKAYFGSSNTDDNLSISFIEEDIPLGTAGSLKSLESILIKPFFVSNCDIIIKSDYAEIVDFHKDSNNDLTIVGSMKHHIVPYGVCEIDNGGDLVKMKEKPEFSFLINTGMYFMEPEILNLIPKNTYFDMNTLINKVKKAGLKVGVFPVSEKSWLDVGQWKEYSESKKMLLDSI